MVSFGPEGATSISKCLDVCVRDLKIDPFLMIPSSVKHTHNEWTLHNLYQFQVKIVS